MPGSFWIELPAIIMRRDAVCQQRSTGYLWLANGQVQQRAAFARLLVGEKRAHLREHIAVENPVFRVQFHVPPIRAVIMPFSLPFNVTAIQFDCHSIHMSCCLPPRRDDIRARGLTASQTTSQN